MSSPFRTRFSGRRVAAFTLIEVLVVVAIIMLLLAILLPTMTKARDMGKRSVCISNLHQQGLALSSYARDHRDMLPYRGFKSYTIAETMHEALGKPGRGRVVCNLGVLYSDKYVGKDWDVLYCPSTFDKSRDLAPNYDSKAGGLSTVADANIIWTFGGYNYAVPLEGRGNCPRLHSKQLYPRELAKQGWKNCVSSQTDGTRELLTGIQALVSDWGVGGMQFVHGTGLDVLYSDLHAKFVITEDPGATSGSLGSYELWYLLSTSY